MTIYGIIKPLNNSLANVSANNVGYIDANNIIHSITTANTSWTSTQNCVMVAMLKSTSNTSSKVTVDGVICASVECSSSCFIRQSVYIKKGQVIQTYSASYDIQFYGFL